MRMTPRRRVLAVGALMFAAGYLIARLMESLRGKGLVCGSTFPGSQIVCDRTGDVSVALVMLLIGVLLLALWLLAGWCLEPLRLLIAPIAAMGPQNLGYRIRADGPQDELRSVADELDRMMDRVAGGYEGQRRFAANASHELRTPLAVQRTLIEVSMAGALNADQIQLVTRQLLDTNERNERLIEGLLVLSESDQGLLSRAPQRLDLIVAGVVAEHQSSAAAAGVALTADVRERTVPGERVLLERLVTNLIQNAIKYNHAGGHVRAEVGFDPALVVTNTGPQVPGEAIAGLFEPFRRMTPDRISHSGGAGLGLTIARSIAQAHQGAIAAYAEPNGGLRVEVRLPT
jgi:signal transduction histidine kinase